MNLCPACSKRLASRGRKRCPHCGALLRLGDSAVPAASVVTLAAEVAANHCSWDGIEFVLRNFAGVRARTLGRLQVRSDFKAGPLCRGLVDQARRLYGPNAGERLESFGLRRSEDIGRVVFALVAAGLLNAQPSDRPEDFNDVLDVRAASQFKIEP
jgi:uncharacterized repeat protein (TIGR04138 family)